MFAGRIVVIGICAAAALGLAACGSDDDDASGTSSTTTTTAPAATTTTVALTDQVRTELGALQRSTIAEIPDLVALFYHHPDGWAVEDTSLDKGETWCRHAWYRWSLEDVTAADRFVVRYTPTKENPECVPFGELVLQVSGRTIRDGQTVLTGEYVSRDLHVERTLCDGTIDGWQSVCGESSGLGEPTATAPPDVDQP